MIIPYRKNIAKSFLLSVKDIVEEKLAGVSVLTYECFLDAGLDGHCVT